MEFHHWIILYFCFLLDYLNYSYVSIISFLKSFLLFINLCNSVYFYLHFHSFWLSIFWHQLFLSCSATIQRKLKRKNQKNLIQSSFNKRKTTQSDCLRTSLSQSCNSQIILVKTLRLILKLSHKDHHTYYFEPF